MHEEQLTQQVLALAKQAGAAIARIYLDDSAWVEHKADGSPLTAADLAAHQVIAQGLAELTPDLPLLSEEGVAPDWERRRQWSRSWSVDPLAGTKEFVGKSGEFTVNIALIEDNQPIFGVIYAPMLGASWCGWAQGEAWYEDANGKQRLQTRALAAPLKLVASRRHREGRDAVFAQRLAAEFGEIERLDMGSSLKMCRIAQGQADIYPRLGPTCEWDTAAADAILRAAGGALLRADGTPLQYNKPDLLNPDFVALGAPVCWSRVQGCWPPI